MSPPPPDPKIYHIVHVDRLPAIIAAGGLRCDAVMNAVQGVGTTIGMSTIKGRRLGLPVHCHKGSNVGDYVPFYFCSRSLMLYVIHKANHPELAYRGGQGPIVHLEADLHEAIDWATGQERQWAFTKANAGAVYREFFNDRADLSQVDWQAIDARNWAAAEIREAKQAEFLMHNSFPWQLVRRIGVQSMATYAQVAAAIKGAQHQPKIEIKPDWYY
jgi:hypothetical protein